MSTSSFDRVFNSRLNKISIIKPDGDIIVDLEKGRIDPLKFENLMVPLYEQELGPIVDDEVGNGQPPLEVNADTRTSPESGDTRQEESRPTVTVDMAQQEPTLCDKFPFTRFGEVNDVQYGEEDDSEDDKISLTSFPDEERRQLYEEFEQATAADREQSEVLVDVISDWREDPSAENYRQLRAVLDGNMEEVLPFRLRSNRRANQRRPAIPREIYKLGLYSDDVMYDMQIGVEDRNTIRIVVSESGVKNEDVLDAFYEEFTDPW